MDRKIPSSYELGQLFANGIAEGMTAVSELAKYRALGTPEQLAARVEVVRCGSCAHKGRPMPHSAMKKWFCTTHGTFMDADGFCSYGERRED